MEHTRTVLITGGAKGIGLACARKFAQAKCNVIIADSNDKAGNRAADDLSSEKGEVMFVSCDVSDLLSVRNLFARIRSTFGRLDVLVNNAGIVVSGDILSLAIDDYDRVMGVNLRGSFLIAQEAAKQMVEQIEEEQDRERERLGNYAIINMSSVNAVMAIADQLAYVTTKGGLNQMTKAMALRLAEYGIRVNAVGPGSINTDVLKSVAGNPEAKRKIMSRTPLGHIAEPEQIASIVQFLASKDASYITGQCLYADGGRLALNYTVDPA